MNDYLTVNEVAFIFDVTKPTIHYWINHCGLQALKPGVYGRGYKTKIKRRDLIKFLKSNRTIGNKYRWEKLVIVS